MYFDEDEVAYIPEVAHHLPPAIARIHTCCNEIFINSSQIASEFDILQTRLDDSPEIVAELHYVDPLTWNNDNPGNPVDLTFSFFAHGLFNLLELELWVHERFHVTEPYFEAVAPAPILLEGGYFSSAHSYLTYHAFRVRNLCLSVIGVDEDLVQSANVSDLADRILDSFRRGNSSWCCFPFLQGRQRNRFAVMLSQEAARTAVLCHTLGIHTHISRLKAIEAGGEICDTRPTDETPANKATPRRERHRQWADWKDSGLSIGQIKLKNEQENGEFLDYSTYAKALYRLRNP